MTRWTERDSLELSELFHMARAFASSRYEAKKLASKWFSERYPDISSTEAYKKLDRDDEWRNLACRERSE